MTTEKYFKKMYTWKFKKIQFTVMRKITHFELKQQSFLPLILVQTDGLICYFFWVLHHNITPPPSTEARSFRLVSVLVFFVDVQMILTCQKKENLRNNRSQGKQHNESYKIRKPQWQWEPLSQMEIVALGAYITTSSRAGTHKRSIQL